MLCYVVLCYVMLCYVMPFYALRLNVTPYQTNIALCYILLICSFYVIVNNFKIPEVEANSEQLLTEVEVNIMGFSPTLR